MTHAQRSTVMTALTKTNVVRYTHQGRTVLEPTQAACVHLDITEVLVISVVSRPPLSDHSLFCVLSSSFLLFYASFVRRVLFSTFVCQFLYHIMQPAGSVSFSTPCFFIRLCTLLKRAQRSPKSIHSILFAVVLLCVTR